MLPARISLLVVFAAFALVSSCDDEDDDGHDDLGPECTAIKEACHEKDDGMSGRVTECHDLAHDGHEDACMAERDDCVMTCEAAPTPG